MLILLQLPVSRLEAICTLHNFLVQREVRGRIGLGVQNCLVFQRDKCAAPTTESPSMHGQEAERCR